MKDKVEENVLEKITTAELNARIKVQACVKKYNQKWIAHVLGEKMYIL